MRPARIEMTPEIRRYLKDNHSKQPYAEIQKVVPYSSFKIKKWLKEMDLDKVTVRPDRTLPYSASDLEFILLIVGKHSRIALDQIRGESRKMEIVLARQVYCYLAFHFTANSGENIGRHIGFKDHTSVYYAVQTVEDLLYVKDDEAKHLVGLCEPEVSVVFTKVERIRHKGTADRKKKNCSKVTTG